MAGSSTSAGWAIASAAAATLMAASPSGAAPQPVVPGITYERVVAGRQVSHVVRVTPGPLVTVRPERSGPVVGNRATLRTMMARRAGVGSIVGINGDYFNFRAGYPSGMLMIDGELIHEPEPLRSAVAIFGNGTLGAVRTELRGEWTSNIAPPGDPPFTFSGVNRSRERNETILYTPRFGRATPTGTDRTDARIRLDTTAPIQPNRTYAGTVTAQQRRGGLTASGRSVVLTGLGGGLNDRVRSYLTPGARVTLRAVVADLPAGLSHAVGGGPRLVDQGVPVRTTSEGFTFGQVAVRSTRSAIGQDGAGRTLIVVTEGPRQGRPGMTMAEHARLLAGLDAQTAVALDSGGSSALMVGAGMPVPQPGGERNLSNAIIVRYAGVRLGRPAGLITPNGDGSRDTTTTTVAAAKRGTATITLVNSAGRRVRTIYSGSAGPTARHITLSGPRVHVPNGRYRVVARFRPNDGSRASGHAHDIVVDRTLGHLSVSKTGAKPVRLRVGFRLTRRAAVTAIVRNSAGTTMAVLLEQRVLERGGNATVWDMRRKGRPIPPGVYSVIVRTRDDGGDRLVARFRVPRP